MEKTIFILLGVCVFGMFNCKKEGPPTVIQGLVTNYATGEPVPDATVFCNIIPLDAPPSTAWRDFSTSTDASGFYSITVPPDHNWDLYEVYKKGFLPKVSPVMGHQFKFGEVNTLDVELIAFDGFIRIVANNIISGNDSLFVKFFSPIQDAEFQLRGWVIPIVYPFELLNNETYEEIIEIPGNDLIKIYWDTKWFIETSSIFKDSIFVARNDTVIYNINF